jgi:hypothetical protein
MAYFEYYPLNFYDLSDSKNQRKIVANITARTKILDSIKNATYIYYIYDIRDGDTPEILASKYYDNPNKHWLILFANDIVDPIYDWPLSYANFEKFIVNKYGSYTSASTLIHHYEKIITKTDSVTQQVTTNKYEIDLDTYNSLPASNIETINLKSGNTVKIETTKKIVYAYDYELELNESKRTIKIIDKIYSQQIENELIALLTPNG